MPLIGLAEAGLVPDALIRLGIRRLLAGRLRTVDTDDASTSYQRLLAFAEQLRTSPLAISTDAANDQHYEVPPEFFQNALGPRLKYSSCLFAGKNPTLAEAEEAMLGLTCERAEIENGMRILELGCGWGSLTLWLAEKFPNCAITAVSNSARQREFIESRAAKAGLDNVRIITADMRDFATSEQFDRVVSVEMFEHMRNYELLLRRLAHWLKPTGKAFVHIFCHRQAPYVFETEGAANWMGRHFFTGGMMPSVDLLAQFVEDLAIEQQWHVSGLHYWRTCEAWLANLDRNREAVVERFRQDVSRREANRLVSRWRIFFLACAELFRYRGGSEWFVAHYRLRPQATTASRESNRQLERV